MNGIKETELDITDLFNTEENAELEWKLRQSDATFPISHHATLHPKENKIISGRKKKKSILNLQ